MLHWIFRDFFFITFERHRFSQLLLKDTIWIYCNFYIKGFNKGTSIFTQFQEWWLGAWFELPTLVVIDSNCISSYTLNYHTITTTTDWNGVHDTTCIYMCVNVLNLENGNSYACLMVNNMRLVLQHAIQISSHYSQKLAQFTNVSCSKSHFVGEKGITYVIHCF